MNWHGIRVTLGCGHMEVRDKPGGERARTLVIGGLEACHVCPVRRRLTGGEVSALRQVVNVEPVTAPRRPEHLEELHWYWEGMGR